MRILLVVISGMQSEYSATSTKLPIRDHIAKAVHCLVLESWFTSCMPNIRRKPSMTPLESLTDCTKGCTRSISVTVELGSRT
ncbi:hypothetical protein GY45DRAFT_1010727 [Cubamyces sp. BRFM 1775]|nr:hypothetical protein GY45DRAFT_1010727 [Cubamyces sp. BRFM 1775]